MPHKIKDVVVTEEHDEMHLYFGSTNFIDKDTTQEVFNMLKQYSISEYTAKQPEAKSDSKSDSKAAVEQKTGPSAENEKRWYNIHKNFDVTLNHSPGKDTIEMKEKNNPPGPYGRGSVLVMVPSELANWGIIERAQSEKMENAIRTSAPVKGRNAKLRSPPSTPRGGFTKT